MGRYALMEAPGLPGTKTYQGYRLYEAPLPPVHAIGKKRAKHKSKYFALLDDFALRKTVGSARVTVKGAAPQTIAASCGKRIRMYPERYGHIKIHRRGDQVWLTKPVPVTDEQ